MPVRAPTCRINGSLPEERCRVANLATMFGPLNGVRVALVAAAVVAAIAAAITGNIGAAVVLLGAVAVHAAGWVYLYNRAQLEAEKAE